MKIQAICTWIYQKGGLLKIPGSVAAAVLVFTLLLCVPGCGERRENVADSPQKREYTAVTEIREGAPNIYVITKSANKFWQIVEQGATAAGADLGCNVYVGGSATEAGWMDQQELVKEAAAAGADGIVIAADDSVKLAGVISETYRAGIPVVLVDASVNTEDYAVVYMTDNLLSGGMAAEEMLRQLKEQGVSPEETVEIAIQVGSTSSQSINERLAGFCQYWAKHAPKCWTIVDDVRCNDGNVELAKKCAAELLETYPDIRGVFGTNNGSTVGFADAVYGQGRTDVVVIGYDYSEEIRNLILDEEYPAAAVLQRPYDMGYRGVGAAAGYDDGEIQQKFVDMGVVIVNRENIEEPDVQEVLQRN